MPTMQNDRTAGSSSSDGALPDAAVTSEREQSTRIAQLVVVIGLCLLTGLVLLSLVGSAGPADSGLAEETAVPDANQETESGSMATNASEDRTVPPGTNISRALGTEEQSLKNDLTTATYDAQLQHADGEDEVKAALERIAADIHTRLTVANATVANLSAIDHPGERQYYEASLSVEAAGLARQTEQLMSTILTETSDDDPLRETGADLESRASDLAALVDETVSQPADREPVLASHRLGNHRPGVPGSIRPR